MSAVLARREPPPRQAERRDAVTAEGCELDVVTSLDGFLALQDEWTALFARAALPHQVFQSHIVLRHWAAAYLDGSMRLHIVVGRRDGRLVMVWPLLRERRFGLDTLRFMGVPVAQFGDVLVEPGPERAALLAAGWQAVTACGADLFEARRLRADSVLAGSGLLATAQISERLEAPFALLKLRTRDGDPTDAYPARERSNHRRRLRRLAERGAVTLRAVDPGAEATALATHAIDLKRESLRRHGIVAPAVADPRFRAFFRSLAGDAAGGSPLRLTVLSCGEATIGVDLSLDCKGTSFGHVIATDPGFEAGGIGHILVHQSFAGARARGNVIFDLMAPADPYKRDHADGSTEVRDLLQPLSRKGRIVCALGLQHVRPALKQAAKRLPAPVVRLVARWRLPGTN